MNQYDEALKKETAFLGQPRGVGTLSFVQLCSSFSNYAMNAVMIYYLYANAPAGLGFDKADYIYIMLQSIWMQCILCVGIRKTARNIQRRSFEILYQSY